MDRPSAGVTLNVSFAPPTRFFALATVPTKVSDKGDWPTATWPAKPSPRERDGRVRGADSEGQVSG